MLKTRVLAGVVAVLSIGLVATSVGWVRSSHKDEPARYQRFDSCHIEGGIAVLDYTYGLNEKVTLTTDSRGDDGIVVSYTYRRGKGSTPALGLLGQLRVVVGAEGGEYGESELRYSDGEPMACKSNLSRRD